MRMNWNLTAAVVASFIVSACSGGGNGSSTPAGPSSTAPTVTINIVGIEGNAAYTPNPAPAASGSKLVFRNNTSVEHHLVMDDGSIDFGSVAAGASSAAQDLPPGGVGNYHCTNHPTMVGSINGTSAPEPPADGGGGVDY
jgi:plastocyanin